MPQQGRHGERVVNDFEFLLVDALGGQEVGLRLPREQLVVSLVNRVVHDRREFLLEAERDQRVVEFRVGRQRGEECDRHAL